MQIQKLIITAGLVCAISFGATPALARGSSAQDFVNKASIANEFEIESSKLALEKSQSNDVKKFAQTMIDQHTKTGQVLEKTLESSKSKAQATEELDDKHQKMLDKLQSASSKNFDSQYIAMQKDAHKDAVNLFSSYSKHGKDTALKNFAADTLPTLKEHLKHVETLKSTAS